MKPHEQKIIDRLEKFVSDITPITADSLAAIGYVECDGYWLPPDYSDRDFSSDEGEHQMPMLAFKAEQVAKPWRGYVQANLYEESSALENDFSMTFWKMTSIGQVLAWHVAFGQPLKVKPCP